MKNTKSSLFRLSQSFFNSILFLLTISVLFSLNTYAAEPQLIEIMPGSDGPFLDGFIDLNGIAIFSAYDEVHGQELWRSDGTFEGTKLVKDIYLGSEGSSPEDFIRVGDEIFFNASIDGLNDILWKTDGTEEGTVLVENIEMTDGVDVNGTLFFYADDGVHGTELWKSDGTEAGTMMVKDITPGASGTSLIYSGEAVGEHFIFTISNNLWSSDGTEVGTQQITSDLVVGDFDDFEGYIYFHGDSSAYGAELWKSDGTVGGTTLLKDIVPGTTGSHPSHFITFNDHLYFWTLAGELYRSDGTTEGTEKIHDYTFDPTWTEPMVELDGNLYFVGADSDWNYGEELWKIEGDTGVTSMVKDIYPGDDSSWTQDLVVVGDKIYFSATDDSEGGYNTEPWVSDGTEEGTHMLANIASEYGEGSYPQFFSKIGDKLFFAAWDSEHGEEIYVLNTATTLSDDSSLSSLVVSGCSISPSFDSGTTSYTCSVPSSVASIFFTGTTSFSGATIKVNGTTVPSGESLEINLVTGVNEINILITAEDGVTETGYVLSATKSAEDILMDDGEEGEEDNEIVLITNIPSEPNNSEEFLQEEEENGDKDLSIPNEEKTPAIDIQENKIEGTTKKENNGWWISVLISSILLVIIFVGLYIKRKRSK